MFDWPKILKAFETHEPLPPLGRWHYGIRFGNAWIAGEVDVDEGIDGDVWKIRITQEPYFPMPEDVCFEFRVEGIGEFSSPLRDLAKKVIRFRLLKELEKLCSNGQKS